MVRRKTIAQLLQWWGGGGGGGGGGLAHEKVGISLFAVTYYYKIHTCT